MIKRSKPPRRKKPFPKPTLDQVQAFERRQRANALLHPIPKFGPKARREKKAREAFSVALQERSGGWCEATAILAGIVQRHDYSKGPCITPVVCNERRHRGTDPHHVWPEDHDYGRHDPARGLWLCRTAHDYAHANIEVAANVGLLRPKGVDTVTPMA